MMPSAGYGDGSWAHYFEPVHGSAIRRFPSSGLLEDSIVNPIATLLSASMMLCSLGLYREADALEKGVNMTLAAGNRTYDIYRNMEGEQKVGTLGMTHQIREHSLRAMEEISR